MTNRLILIRHAKAEGWGIDDSQRRLAPRGERDAREIGAWLREAGISEGVAFISPAARTIQTWDLAAAELTEPPRVVRDERIYRNSVEDLLAVINEAPADASTVLLVGHNPSIAALASALDDGSGDRSAAREIATKYPTSGIATFAVDAAWASLAAGSAALTGFTAPRG